MPTRKIEKELEAAILGMPVKEKNKLLIRLIGKDDILTEQLQYKLLEDPVFDLQVRFEAIDKQVTNIMQSYGLRDIELMLWSLRKISGLINRHKKVTADRLTEVRLWVNCLYLSLDSPSLLKTYVSRDSEKIAVYFIKKTLQVIKLTKTLHEDYWIEFAEDINRILDFCHHSDYRFLAKTLGVPKQMED
ncbi:MAG: hypothetical protein ACRCVT_03930 [Leadbetterella sp.]